VVAVVTRTGGFDQGFFIERLQQQATEMGGLCGGRGGWGRGAGGGVEG
jgi:hypothetical protein